MTAVRLPDWGRSPVVTELARPLPRDGQVLVRVEAVGLCRSDLHVIDADRGTMPFRPPFTLGHEVAGRITAHGPAAAVTVGRRVVIHGPWGCGSCLRCTQGRDNYCDRRAELSWAGMGLGLDGGMAEYVLVPSARHLVPIGDLDAGEAAPLTDAGLTSYHAVAGIRPRLGADSTVAVIGVGGLGHLAVQMLRALTPCRVIAVDVREEALALAERSGAHLSTKATTDTSRVLRATTSGTGVDAVLDFVGSRSTLDLGTRGLRADGDLVLVGSGGGELTVRKPGSLPPGSRISLPFWGSRDELADVVALSRSGALKVEAERFPLTAVHEAMSALRDGRLSGRAVLVPG
ncbi:propanol-preferring alcohol dehydrogenase [Saccharopolyspora erythraea NRRL 2338]|uniref:alcohol dehydrogenase n=2 Tax=Saccharopolyspora erythraea TaxID=1836 RepID=A4FD94_SACEN|nr:NAD(P)-dependent alcohol dehydrogenase [Saccharopolyspora erythraea]PFG95762.1 propanol-preferring alcohol dehydrogenase [Saccharopolyspora erythraea NRRL 2338]QRK92352.1 NAD(P)-dependent alcohol dehydrogenase [Saccharopolyspora erythraea]CAM02019.1 alcohol dehydrogenase GroES-like protein [Saccharopolyspora erythraea NRRL 2338]